MKRMTLRGGINRALAVVFVAIIGVVCAMTLLTGGDGISSAVRRMDYLRAYLPDNWNGMDLFNARLRSLESKLGAALWGSEELGRINSGFQYALGKRMINTGGAQMVTLNTGHLYDLQAEIDVDPKVREIIEFRDMLDAELPFLFVYEHPVVYDEKMFPDGYEKLDYGTAFADEALSIIRAAGIDAIDSRDVLNASGYSYDELLYRTDQHWSTLAAIVMARDIAGHVAKTTGLPLNAELLDPSSFDTEVHKGLFLGRYGQRIGAALAPPDDVVTYSPKYPTDIRRETFYLGIERVAEGAFGDAALRTDRLARGADGYNTSAYTDYGFTEAYEKFRNADAPRVRILLIKDSYSAPIGAFLSLVASDVYAVDMRHYSGSLNDVVERFEPDVVIVAYSQQMLRDESYQFVG